jgi:UDP-N-acetyl-2-amino-2-deoxyglucuronate dehydrogenase
VLNPWNLDGLEEIERESGKKVFNILQLRLHPSLVVLKRKMELLPKDKIHDIDLTYITSRGKWYFYSWKGNPEKSGGVVTNIGIHFFDMLSWIFGDVVKSEVHLSQENKAAGYLQLKQANVRWLLSVDRNDLPQKMADNQVATYRSIKVDGNEIELSGGFDDLHTESYKQILAGNGFGIQDARNSIEIVHDIRNKKPVGIQGDYHPFLTE